MKEKLSSAKTEPSKNSKKSNKLVFHKLPFLNLFYTSLAINLITALGVLLLRDNLPPELPLYYGLPEGEEQLSSKLGLVLAPVSSLSILLLNGLLSLFIKSEFLRKSLILAAFLVSILTLITTAEIVFLVGTF